MEELAQREETFKTDAHRLAENVAGRQEKVAELHRQQERLQQELQERARLNQVTAAPLDGGGEDGYGKGAC